MNNKAFTVIDVLVLMVICGILLSVAISGILNNTISHQYCDEFSTDPSYCVNFLDKSNLHNMDIRKLINDRVTFDKVMKVECELKDNCSNKILIDVGRDSHPTNAWKLMNVNTVLFYNTDSKQFLADVELYKNQSDDTTYISIKYIVNMNDGILVGFK